jgi:iron complex outermembrane receptor protein
MYAKLMVMVPVVVLVLGTGSIRARAQSAPAAASNSGLEEIVITAQRRSESIQKSSLAIQSVSGDQLVAAGVTQAKDLNAIIPGLQIATGGTATQIFIRGVGDFSTNPTANPGVAFNVDGVYVGRPEAIGGNFYDVDRIEVLKGPQGTLYGRNASGGAINVITRHPTLGDSSGNLSVTFGNYAMKEIEGAVNIPIAPTLALRTAFDMVDRNGYLSDGSDDDKHQAIRLQLLWAPSDAVSLVTRFDYAHTGGNGPGYVPLPTTGGSDRWAAAGGPAGLAQLASQVPFGPLLALWNGGAFVDNVSVNASAELRSDMGWATLTVLPAYRSFRDRELNFPGFSNSENFHSDEYTAEVRLNHDDDKMHWVTGLYYYNERENGRAMVSDGLVQTASLDYSPLTTKAYAAFGQISYSVLSDLRIIGGARYTIDDRASYGSLNVDTFGNTSTSTFAGTAKFDSFTWKAGLEYDVAAQNMLYFTASTGFKAGGINAAPPPNAFQPEKLTAFELGSRNRFLEDRLQVNLEVFKWGYQDHQENVLTFDSLGEPDFLTVNAGTASLYGFSVDIQAKITPSDTFGAYSEYNHARYDNFSLDRAAPTFSPLSTSCPVSPVHLNSAGLPIVTANCAGYQLERAPTWAGSAGWEHRFDLPNGGKIVANPSAYFSSARWGAIDFTVNERFTSYVVGNLDLTYVPRRANWSVTGFVHNISNVAVYTGGIQQSFAPPLLYATISPPRTFGARFDIGF